MEKDTITARPSSIPPVQSDPPQTTIQQIIYKVQILTSNKELSLNDHRFKGHKGVSFYKENGVYKYTIGECNTLEECNRIRKQLLPDFNDAFVVRFVNGVRQNK